MGQRMAVNPTIQCCLIIFTLTFHTAFCANTKADATSAVLSPFLSEEDAKNFLGRSSRQKRSLYHECVVEGCWYEEVREVYENTEQSKEYLFDHACTYWPCDDGYWCVMNDAGTAGSGSHWRGCVDADECATNNGGCDHTCVNNFGSYECRCNRGYSLSGQHSCIDVNECSTNNGGCDHVCSNNAGSFSCSCNTGYSLSGRYSCTDDDECSANNGGCDHGCDNTVGSYICSCNTGYRLSGQHACTDIDECASGNGGCDHLCANTAGSYSCSCNTGYYLSGQHSCGACDSIADCEVLECTGPGDSTCTRCQYDRGGDVLGYRLASDGKSCTQLCSWRPDSLFCYPGNCSTDNLPSSCACAPGFNGTNCLSIQVPPQMTYCVGRLIGAAGDVAEAACTDFVTASSTVWTNLQQESETVQFEATWETAFEEPSASDWPEPYYVDERKIGMTEACTDWWLDRGVDETLNGTLTCQSYENGDTSHVVSQDSPALLSLNCTRGHVITVTPQHGDRLYFTAKSRNGGFLTIRNYDGSSGYTVDPPFYYSGQVVSHTADMTFDFVPPYHCSVEGNCTDNMLDRGPAITRNGNVQLRWSGWRDDDSGLRGYRYEVIRLQPCGDGLGMPGQEDDCQPQSDSPLNGTDGLCARIVNDTVNGTNITSNATDQNITTEGFIVWENCTSVEGNGTEAELNTTGEKNATASTPVGNSRQIREAGSGNNTTNITMHRENNNCSVGCNGTYVDDARNSTGADSSMDGRNVTGGANGIEVDDDVMYALNGSVEAETEEVNVTITEPGVYSITLTVEDSTGPGLGNVIMARRFLLFDDNSTVEIDTSGNFSLRVTSAANNTDLVWQTNLHDENDNHTKVQLTWSGHFFNKLHRDNNFLGAIVAHPANITAEYDEISGQPPITRSREAIRHVHGIVLFQTSWGVDHQGGRSLGRPSGNWENVTDVTAEEQDFDILREDGDTVRFWVRAIDVMGDVAEDNVTVHVDSSPPALENVTFAVNWTDKIDFLIVHVQAHDVHSGLSDVHWTLQDSASPQMIHGEGRMMFDAVKECEAAQCYCIPKESDCFFWEFTVEIDVREMNLSVTFLANETYYVTLTVTNNAMLRTVDIRHVIVDKLPGENGFRWLLLAAGSSAVGLVLLMIACLLVLRCACRRKVAPAPAPVVGKYQPATTMQLQPTSKHPCNQGRIILPPLKPADVITTTF